MSPMARKHGSIPTKRVSDVAANTDFLSTVFESLTGYAIAAIDFDGRIIAFNEGARAIYGHAPEEVIGKANIEILFTPEFVESGRLNEVITEVLRLNKASFEELQVRKTGSVFPAQILFSPCRDRNGKIIGFVQIAQDVTEQKEAQEALQRSEERLQNLIERNADGIIIVGQDGTIKFVNPAAENLFQRAAGELVGAPFGFPLMATNASLIELTVPGATGCVVEIRASTVEWEGTPATMASLRDVTERENAVAALQEANDFLDSLIRHTSVPIVVWDSQMRVTRFNRAFEDLSGRTATEVIGQSVDTLFPLPLQSASKDPTSKAATRERWEAVEVPIVTREGETRIVLWNSATVFARDGRTPLATIAQGLDITERRQKEEEVLRLNVELERRVDERTAQLAASNKELQSFAYSVSHDLRAPLRAMDGFSQILLEDYASDLPDEAQRYLGLISNSAHRMGSLIDALLMLSRTGHQPLNKESVAPANLARKAIDDLMAEREGRDVEITIGALPDCQADPALLHQVYANLLGNALKFTRGRKRTTIEVGCLKTSDEDVYFVKDNGAGFDMKYADRLFGVFQRLHNVDEFEGMGVGLATVQRIVHRHGGRIWADSTLDQGATFYFTLPGQTDRDDF